MSLNDYIKHIMNKVFQQAFGISAGLIIGVIAAFFISLLINDYNAQPDFKIYMDHTYIPTRDNTSFTIYITNLDDDKYQFPISLAAYNMKYKNAIEYGNITQYIKIFPNDLDKTIYIHKEDKQTDMGIYLGENASGMHLIEVLAFGGDGKQRTCQFVLSIK